MKSKRWLLLYLIIIVPSLCVMSFMPFNIQPYRYFIYTGKNNPLPLLIILFIITPLIGVVLGYLIGPLLFKFHKLVFGKKMTYIFETNLVVNKKINFSDVFFPALLTISLALPLGKSSYMQELLLTEEQLGLEGVNLLFMIFYILPMTILISTIIYASCGFLKKRAIYYKKKDKMDENKLSGEIILVGTWYLSLLKGFTGISVLLNFYVLIPEILSFFQSNMIFFISELIALLVFPFMLSALFIPYILVFNYFSQKEMKLYNLKGKRQ